MSGKPLRVASLAFSVVLLAASAFAIGPVRPGEGGRLDSLGREAYRTLWEFHPVDATRCGFHDFDGRLGDYSPARTAALKIAVNRFLAQLASLDTLSLSLDDRIDRELLVANLKMELFWLDRFGLLERDPHYYSDECVGGVYYVLLRDFTPLPVRVTGAVNRAHAADAYHFLNRITVGKCDTCLKLAGSAGILVAPIVGQVREYARLQCFSPIPINYSLLWVV